MDVREQDGSELTANDQLLMLAPARFRGVLLLNLSTEALFQPMATWREVRCKAGCGTHGGPVQKGGGASQ